MEVFTLSNLVASLEAGCGATVLRVDVAESLSGRTALDIRPLGEDMVMPLSICIPDSEGLSDAAYAVYRILDRLVRGRPALQGAA